LETVLLYQPGRARPLGLSLHPAADQANPWDHYHREPGEAAAATAKTYCRVGLGLGGSQARSSGVSVPVPPDQAPPLEKLLWRRRIVEDVEQGGPLGALAPAVMAGGGLSSDVGAAADDFLHGQRSHHQSRKSPGGRNIGNLVKKPRNADAGAKPSRTPRPAGLRSEP